MITVGTKLKRQFYDFAIVEVIKAKPDENYIIIKDADGKHYVKRSNIKKYFTIVKEDEISNTTEPASAHSIAAGMNDPSEIQKKAFEKENK
jgi:hypothetical protein